MLSEEQLDRMIRKHRATAMRYLAEMGVELDNALEIDLDAESALADLKNRVAEIEGIAGTVLHHLALTEVLTGVRDAR